MTTPHHPPVSAEPDDESGTAETEFDRESDPGVSAGESTLFGVLKLVGVFVVIGVAIFVARNYFGTGSAQADIGRCAKLSGSTTKAEIAFRDCGDPEANYVVAQRLNGVDSACASPDYISYYQTGGESFTLCLRLNVTEGDCVNGTLTGASTRVNCTAAADFRVDRIVRGTADRSVCGGAATEENTLVYPQPEPATLCLLRPTTTQRVP